MSSAEAQQQQNWPDLDVRYFRWDPPVYPGAATSSASPTDATKKGAKPRIESAFAHSTFPAKLAGWDSTRGELSSDLPSRAQDKPYGDGDRGAGTSEQTVDLQGMPMSFRNAELGQSSSEERIPTWGNSQQLHQQCFGSSFDNLFALAQPAGLRYGVPQAHSGQTAAAPANATASVCQSSAPFLTVQCGRFNAPVQREAPPLPPPTTTQPMSSQLQQDFQAWSRQQDRRAGGTPASNSRGSSKLKRMPSVVGPLQLQEYYTAQSDLLEGIMNMHSHRQSANNVQPQSMDPGLMDIFGPLQLGRAISSLEVPTAHSLTAAQEPYMPQWQSESVPAELPNHVVDRLLMNGNSHNLQRVSRHSRSNSLSGSKRSWGGLPTMPSIPDGREFPPDGRASPPDSPDVDHLEELARTADLEVAHRAFLVPPHKKRGKGGRQPAADPRLDPNIDERKAKRILANRLSAARSKMKQKNQMDVLSGIIDQLEYHNKELHEDVAELMEVCEVIEFNNRAMVRDCHIIEEFLRRGRERPPGPGA